MKDNMFDGLTPTEESQILIEILQEFLDQNYNDTMPCIPTVVSALKDWEEKYGNGARELNEDFKLWVQSNPMLPNIGN